MKKILLEKALDAILDLEVGVFSGGFPPELRAALQRLRAEISKLQH